MRTCDILQSSAIVVVQEVHGDWEKVRKDLHFVVRTHHVHFSAGDHKGTAGVLNLIKKSLIPEVTSVPKTELVKGRVLASVIEAGDKSTTVVNVHNERLTESQRRKVQKFVEAKKKLCLESPDRHSMWLAGDFNFAAAGDSTIHLLAPEPKGAGDAILRTNHAGAKMWETTLAGLTEIQQKLQTHYDVATSSRSRIDREFTPRSRSTS